MKRYVVEFAADHKKDVSKYNLSEDQTNVYLSRIDTAVSLCEKGAITTFEAVLMIVDALNWVTCYFLYNKK